MLAIEEEEVKAGGLGHEDHGRLVKNLNEEAAELLVRDVLKTHVLLPSWMVGGDCRTC